MLGVLSPKPLLSVAETFATLSELSLRVSEKGSGDVAAEYFFLEIMFIHGRCCYEEQTVTVEKCRL